MTSSYRHFCWKNVKPQKRFSLRTSFLRKNKCHWKKIVQPLHSWFVVKALLNNKTDKTGNCILLSVISIKKSDTIDYYLVYGDTQLKKRKVKPKLLTPKPFSYRVMKNHSGNLSGALKLISEKQSHYHW